MVRQHHDGPGIPQKPFRRRRRAVTSADNGEICRLNLTDTLPALPVATRIQKCRRGRHRLRGHDASANHREDVEIMERCKRNIPDSHEALTEKPCTRIVKYVPEDGRPNAVHGIPFVPADSDMREVATILVLLKSEGRQATSGIFDT